MNLTIVENEFVTLYDIVMMINEERVARGENPLRHDKQMVKVTELAKEPSFGWVSKMSTLVEQSNNGAKQGNRNLQAQQKTGNSSRC